TSQKAPERRGAEDRAPDPPRPTFGLHLLSVGRTPRPSSPRRRSMSTGSQADSALDERSTAPNEDEADSRESLLERCNDLAHCDSILDRVGEAIAAGGFAGDTSSVLITYLAIVSRLLERPVSLAVRGPSSAGKSHTIKEALRFHPVEAYFEMTAMSPKAL